MHQSTTLQLNPKEKPFSSSANNQPVLLINKCINWLHCNMIQRGILSPSSSSNQSVLSINKCIDWLLCNTIQRGILSTSSPNNQPVLLINKCIDQLLCNMMQRGFSFLSQQSTSTVNQQVLSINNCVDWLLCNLIQRGVLSSSSPNNQPVLSIDYALIDYFATWSEGDSFLPPLTTINQQNHWTIMLIDKFATHQSLVSINILSSHNSQQWHWQAKGSCLSNVAILFSAFFKLPMLIDIHLGSKRKNKLFLWFPSTSP